MYYDMKCYVLQGL